MLRYPLVSCRYPIFSVNACIYSTLRPFLCQHLGALPQALSLARPQGQVAKPNHLPYGECWSRLQGVKGKMHGFAALTPFQLCENSRRSEADGAGNLSRLAKQPLAAWPLQVGGDPTLCGKGAGGFPLHPCHVANWVWAAPTVLARPLGVAR